MGVILVWGVPACNVWLMDLICHYPRVEDANVEAWYILASHAVAAASVVIFEQDSGILDTFL